ncbi:hypothetical protein DFH09DRAFT_1095064 [Mycena vulgaris]|nr:hypothetical protein DFH09DRAFT_1095064 [Mycena vulgaris]
MYIQDENWDQLRSQSKPVPASWRWGIPGHVGQKVLKAKSVPALAPLHGPINDKDEITDSKFASPFGSWSLPACGGVTFNRTKPEMYIQKQREISAKQSRLWQSIILGETNSNPNFVQHRPPKEPSVQRRWFEQPQASPVTLERPSKETIEAREQKQAKLEIVQTSGNSEVARSRGEGVFLLALYTGIIPGNRRALFGPCCATPPACLPTHLRVLSANTRNDPKLGLGSCLEAREYGRVLSASRTVQAQTGSLRRRRKKKYELGNIRAHWEVSHSRRERARKYGDPDALLFRASDT